MDLFDLIGPVMIGPSSSHTAGAARIGLTARMLMGEEITRDRKSTRLNSSHGAQSRMPSSA